MLISLDKSSLSSMNPFFVLAVATGAWSLFRILHFLTRPLRSPLRVIDGPKGSSILFGSFMDLMDGKAYDSFRQWKEKYGHVLAIRAVLGELRCITTDNKAVAHLLSNNMIYYKPEPASFHLAYLIGPGLVSAEGMEHRHQRKRMVPAFSPSHLRDILPIFLAKSAELRDVLLEGVTEVAPGSSTSTPSAKVNILNYLYYATLDIIGLSGFNYDFNTLRHGEEASEFAAILGRVTAPKQFPLIMLIKGAIPAFRIWEFDSFAREAAQLRRLVRKIGLQLIEKGQMAVIAEKASAGGTVLEKGHDKDLLSLMIRSNLSPDVPPEQRLSVEQMLQQIPTFLIAGHETTANSTGWGIFALATRPIIQNRLRAELLEAFPADDSTPVTLEALNKLTYLDAVVREILRYHPTVPFSARQAQVDDVIPLEKGFIGRDGKFRDHIEVKKGDQFVIPLIIMNRLKEVWGEDADEFNPDRWLRDLPSAASAVPGVWANLMTFMGGPRSCIGFKFAILEMKALLLYLIRAFEFELAVAPEDIVAQEIVVSRPIVKYEADKGPQIPVIIRPVKA